MLPGRAEAAAGVVARVSCPCRTVVARHLALCHLLLALVAHETRTVTSDRAVLPCLAIVTRIHIDLTRQRIGCARRACGADRGACKGVVASTTLDADLSARRWRKLTGAALLTVAFAAGRRQTGLAVDAGGRPCDCKLA